MLCPGFTFGYPVWLASQKRISGRCHVNPPARHACEHFGILSSSTNGNENGTFSSQAGILTKHIQRTGHAICFRHSLTTTRR